MEESITLLVVEDDEAIGRPLTAALRGQGYDTLWALTAAEALDLAATEPPALILLDLGLPDLDGVELCRQLRTGLPAAVIVVLSARADDLDIVLGLEAGADDYLTKPFQLPVLLARVRAHVRRQGSPTLTAGAEQASTFGALRVDLGARRCEVAGQEVPLRPKEFELLAALVATPGQAVTRERLMSEVWDEHWSGPTKTLDMHVSSLRRKLAEHGEDPARIVTLRGYGYRFDPPERASASVAGRSSGSREPTPG